ncbi:hypothetical protein LCIT_03930 [Leuconostoc citreum]|uniref:Uncharacterized protein n=1 Tax=Leuconostoc citreum TaxID=33964 RepID=A0A5A5TXB2_LEUCI|nr:hypothetical protein [Leuconostoc citreum]MCP1276285.1 hypothetical protein [Leuconostoc citreum]GDZ83151.1 hypothetical protein LCIT_03930 [Leuconostoc citreum]
MAKIEKWISDFVRAAIALKASGLRTSNDNNLFVQIDTEELGARLKANGGLKEMMTYVAQADNFSIRSTWESSLIAIKTLQEMRAEKNA